MRFSCFHAFHLEISSILHPRGPPRTSLLVHLLLLALGAILHHVSLVSTLVTSHVAQVALSTQRTPGRRLSSTRRYSSTITAICLVEFYFLFAPLLGQEVQLFAIRLLLRLALFA